jgi:hypothetical protein
MRSIRLVLHTELITNYWADNHIIAMARSDPQCNTAMCLASPLFSLMPQVKGVIWR